jgi:hypothetical protein
MIIRVQALVSTSACFVIIIRMIDYQAILTGISDIGAIEDYLQFHSSLPGPRSNLELAYAAADILPFSITKRWLDLSPLEAPENTPQVFLVVIAVMALGRVIAKVESEWFICLRKFAADPRWRVRESVAMALQYIGRKNWELLLEEVNQWIGDDPLEMRAVAAGLCEPDLLLNQQHACQVLDLLQVITERFVAIPDRKSGAVRTLRQGLGYCWSVAIVAAPVYGKPLFEGFTNSPDPDVKWIVRENLKKNRLIKMDKEWVINLQI